MRSQFHYLVVVSLAAALACASSGGPDLESEIPAEQRESRNSNVITREEIQATGMANLGDVIRTLRPQYLRGRGRTSINLPADEVAVYVDNVHMGGVSSLSTIGSNGVLRVEFVRGPDTGFKFGLDHQAGVIHVITKP